MRGAPLLLGDVADVVTGPQSRRGLAELNGEGEVVGGIIVMRYGENAQHTIDGVKARLAQLKSSLPEGVESSPSTIDPILSSAPSTTSPASWWRSSRWWCWSASPSCSTCAHPWWWSSPPIAILTAFIVMHLQGINANIMSLGGIAIAIGAMVDGAIVMIENVHKHMEREALTDKNRWRIITEASIEVGPAIFFSLLIITISFLPVFALEAQEGGCSTRSPTPRPMPWRRRPGSPSRWYR